MDRQTSDEIARKAARALSADELITDQVCDRIVRDVSDATGPESARKAIRRALAFLTRDLKSFAASAVAQANGPESK